MTKYTTEQIEVLMNSYNSPTNEFAHLSFDEWVKAAEDAECICDLLAND